MRLFFIVFSVLFNFLIVLKNLIMGDQSWRGDPVTNLLNRINSAWKMSEGFLKFNFNVYFSLLLQKPEWPDLMFKCNQINFLLLHENLRSSEIKMLDNNWDFLQLNPKYAIHWKNLSNVVLTIFQWVLYYFT